MPSLKDLSPSGIWTIFEEITRIPRPSKKEGKIIKYLEDFAAKHSLECKKDKTGNIIMRRPASLSMSERPTVILQSHMDMVCEKNSDVDFDFDNDPIQAYVDNDGWVKAKGTTLGADDGIGMAAALAILTDESLELPTIEALFTVDEETGLTGAFGLEKGILTGKYLINLDSEDDGEIFIGCAGGIDTLAEFKCESEAVEGSYVFLRVDIKGLKGGHSGDDIDKGFANSNKLLARLLQNGIKESELRLCRFDGGNLRNAIPREAFATLAVHVKLTSRFFECLEKFSTDIRGEYSETETGIDITVAEIPAEKQFMTSEFQNRFLNALQGLPNGVLAMSMSMQGLVETSTNLASVKQDGDIITVTTSQRSSIDSARMNAAASVRSVLELAGAKVKHSEGYPGWNPDPSSKLLEVAVNCYKELFGQNPKVRAIHAGLECGLFLQKYPELEMVSIGPTLRGVHSPDEKLEIATVSRFWEHLVCILKKI